MIRKHLAIALTLAILLAGAFALAEGTLTVLGTGEVYVEADRVNISLGVREIAPDVQTAQSTVNAKLSSILSALNGMGVDKNAIVTSNIGIYPNYDYNSSVETISGYTAYNDLSITLSEVERAGTIIDAAFAAGANTLNSVEFSTSDTSQAAEEAMALAVISARDKARLLADATGMRLGDLLEICEGSDNGYVAENALMARSEEAADGGTTLMAGRQRICATVRLTYSISRSTSTRKK